MKDTPEAVYLLPWEPLREVAEEIFLAGQSPPAEAALIAARLVGANLAGHDSHGLIRLHQYMDRLRQGMIKAGTPTTTVKEQGSIAVLSGNAGYGQPHATRAMEEAIARARKSHIAAVGVTDLAHIGRLTDYANMAAAQGMIGMTFTSTGGFSTLVAPFGGAARRMSTNPLAVSFPTTNPYPVVFDFASSAYAEGKFRVMKDGGISTPPGILIDAQGAASRNPEDLYGGGAILPLGGAQGYKGYMLNFMMEVLGGLLSGGGFMGSQSEPPFNNCSLMICLDVNAFREPAQFAEDLEGLIQYLQETKPLPGAEVLRPGEKEHRTEQARKKQGVPLAQTTLAGIQSELDHYGIKRQLQSLGTLAEGPVWSF